MDVHVYRLFTIIFSRRTGVYKSFVNANGTWKQACLLSTGKKNYYDTLGITPKAPQSAVKTAYFKLSKKYHPDVSSDSDSMVKFREVTEAYETLGNKQLRRVYDQSLQISPLAGYAPSPSRNTHGPQTGRTSTFNYDEWVQQHYGEDYLSNKKTRYREEYYQTEYYRGKRVEKYRSYVYFKILGVVALVTTITYSIMYYNLRDIDLPQSDCRTDK